MRRPPLRIPRAAAGERAGLHQDLFSDGPGRWRRYVVRLALLTALSAALAAIGLIQDSTAVVIGAMLVSPLMQPLIGLAAALVCLDRRRQLVSLGLVGGACAVSVAIGAGVAAASATVHAVTVTSELSLRTAPGILDLAVAVGAGAAGAYVTVHREGAVALPGAAIAVALMPPLAATGILLQEGHGDLAAGAVLLFVTNLLGIVVASALVLTATGHGPTRALTHHDWVTLALPVVVVAAVAYPLWRGSRTSVHQTRDEAAARRIVVPALRAQRLGLLDMHVVEDGRTLVASFDVAGPTRPTDVEPLARALAERSGRPTRLILRWTRRLEQEADAPPPAG